MLIPPGLRLIGSDGADTLVGGEELFAPAWITARGGDDSVTGGNSDDAIEGGDGADTLRGLDGNDELFGGLGGDRLYGGAGADRFVFTRFADSPDFPGGDVIEDFDGAQDRIDLRALGAVAIDLANDGEGFVRVIATGAAGILQFRIRTGTGIGAVTTDHFLTSDAPRGPSEGADAIAGSAVSELLRGLGGNDLFHMQQGGFDKVDAGGGNDGLYFGDAFDNDMVDGGDDIDTLVLQGSYRFDGPIIHGNPLGADLANVVNVEVVALLSGGDTRFGDGAGNSYDYLVRASDRNIAAGGTLTLIASGLGPDEDLTFYGTAESDGHFRIFAGRGTDVLVGGAGNDGFFFGADGNLGAGDRIMGGTGVDTLALRGLHAGSRAIVLADDAIDGIEVIAFLSGHSNEHGGFIAPDGFDYDVSLADGNVAAGQRLDVIATGLRADESVRFDARSESDGSARILSGAGDDALFGGAGADILHGGLGSDALDGGGGADIYQYRAVAESTAAAMDRLAFGAGDRIDLGAIDAVAGTAGNDAFSFIGSASFSGAAGELRLVLAGVGQWRVEGDVDGDGIADLVIAVAGVAPLDAGDFVL